MVNIERITIGHVQSVQKPGKSDEYASLMAVLSHCQLDRQDKGKAAGNLNLSWRP